MSNFRLKMLLGYILVMGMLALGAAIALGKVEEKTSFGLTAVVAVLGKLVLDFSQWAFHTTENGHEEKKGQDNG